MKTVVILLSDKRSGSTMFQDAICQHPDIQTVSYSPHTYLETHHWLKAAVILNPEKKIYDGYGSLANARTYLIDCIRGNVSDFKIPRDDKDLVFAGWDALCEKFAKPVFFEKSPQYLGEWPSIELLLEWIEQTDCTVKIIGLTRNPLSVQYSAWKLFHRDPKDRQFGWIKIQKHLQAVEAKLADNQFLHVKYEAIIDQPASTFETICKFIGVAADETVVSKVHGKSLTKWKEDPYFTFRLDERVKSVAREFGYSEEELDNPEKPAPPYSYRIKKKLEAIYKLSRARIKDRIIKPLLLKRTHSSRNN